MGDFVRPAGFKHTKETKSKTSIAMSGKKNHFYRHGKCLKRPICKGCGKEIANYYASRCMSCANKFHRRRLGMLPNHGKWLDYKGFRMRSSYEVRYAIMLDSQSAEWLYEQITFDLGYTTYTPDFYVFDRDEFIEVKGWWREDALKKFKLFNRLYPTIKIRVITKQDLN